MKKKILALVHLPPPMHGAAMVSEKLLGSKCINDNFNIIISPVQLSSKIKSIGNFSFSKIIYFLKNIFRAAYNIALNRPDLAYMTLPPHGGGFYACLPYVIMLKLARITPLYHIHGKGISAAAQKSRVYRVLMTWVARQANFIILSELLLSDCAEFFPRHRVHIIPNFVPTPLPKRRLVASGTPHIIFLSNLVESKGPLILLDALAFLAERRIRFKATFTGEAYPPLTPESFRDMIIHRGLGEFVSYIGPVYDQAKYDLLETADIFAFPSFNDAFPLVVLEAMDAGLAVIATPEGAIPDIIDDKVNGILVPHHNSAALANAIGALIENPELRAKLAEAGQRKAKEVYALDNFTDRMAQLWRDLA